MGIIYKLEIGNYHYYGKTTTRFSTRYNAHKKSCFNRSKRSYWTKLYVKIRQLGVKKSQWNEKVKYKIIYKNCIENEVEYYEFSCINTSNPWNLNTMDKTITEFYTKEVVTWGTLTTEEQQHNNRMNSKNHYNNMSKERQQKKNKKINDKHNKIKKLRIEKEKEDDPPIEEITEEELLIKHNESLEYQTKYYAENKTRMNVNSICLICNCNILKRNYNKHCKTRKHIKNSQ